MAFTWKITEVRPSTNVPWYEFNQEHLEYLEQEYRQHTTGFMEFTESEDGLTKTALVGWPDEEQASRFEADEISIISGNLKQDHCDLHGITRTKEVIPS